MKKNMLRLFLAAIALVLVFSVSAFTVQAEETTTAVASSSFFTHQGEEFVTTIYIPDNANIVDFELTLTYDTELLTLVSAEENEDAKGTVIFNTQTPGEIAINYTRTSKNVTSYLPLIDLTFTVDDNAGIGVYDCLTLDMSQTYVAHRMDDAGNTNEIPFTCSFAQLQIYEMGDVNLSGKVDIADATALRRHLAAFSNSILTDFKLSLADTYYDKVIDIADPSCLQRRLARYNVVYGNRVNITFLDMDGNKVTAKSVVYNGTLSSIPLVPNAEGYEAGVWSQSATEYIAPVYTNMTQDVTLYAYYAGGKVSEAVEYYKRQLTEQYYTGDLATGLSSSLNLWTTMNYQDGYYANFIWNSDSNYILNPTTGEFTKPTYPQEMTLTVKIISYDSGNMIEAEDSISFAYQVPGMFTTPTKSEISDWLKNYFTDPTDNKYRVNFDVSLASKVTNEVLPSNGGRYDDYEVRLEWFQNVDGTLVPLSKIKRTTATQVIDYVAVATFNGKPLEGDGKIYIEDVEVTAIEQMEIRDHIINKIAANMGTLATEGTELWNNDTVYGTQVTWETGDPTIAYVANNKIELKANAVSGAILPLNARVSYEVDDGWKEFVLSYNLTVSCDNTVIQAPQNMDAELYKALKAQLEEELGYRGDLTSAALADVRFVNLDLSGYPDITSLRGLSYCVNLRTLNISGLKITDGTMNQIATLSYLEAFIARDCELDNLSDGGTPTLKNAVNLRMIDLSNNNFTSLDSVFAEGYKYGKLREVYLSNNQLQDISALSRAPLMDHLSLANNGLTTEDTETLANFPLLYYLSLAGNEIDSVEHLTGLKGLFELRLHDNNITSVNGLRKLINLEALYLGNNQIQDIGFLNTLTNLKLLYVNDNRIFDLSALTALSELQVINVNNNKITSLSVLANYKDTMEEIYAENNLLTDFSFINGATKLHILMLSGNHAELAQTNMTSWLTTLTEMEILTLSDIRLNDLSFLASMQKLVRLDVANCGLSAFSGEQSNIAYIANCYTKLRILDISNNDMAGSEAELLKLKDLSLLTVLYADNVCDALDVTTLTYSMPELKFISLENCGITTAKWLFKYNELVYVDLAGNNISSFSFDSDISNASIKTLKELYLDTGVPCTFTDAYRMVDFNVEKLSLAGISVNRVEQLPYMDQIRYLNLSNTGLTSYIGDDAELAEMYSMDRYTTLETLDVSGVEAGLSALENLPNLKTLYAVGATDSKLFYQENLHALQRMYNAGIVCYLYDKQTAYEPVAAVEGKEILALLEDLSCDVKVAADNVFSDNNPFLADQINGYDITWTVSNTDNYEIANNHLSVKDYTGIEDEALTVTAQITVYDDQAPVTREFQINTQILRASAEYFETNAAGYSERLSRDKVFTYDLQIVAKKTADFAVDVKPVVDYITYDYATTNEIPYTNILSVGEGHTYTVVSYAPLNETVTIQIRVGHIAKDGTQVDDVATIEAPVTISSRTFTATFVLNGGQLTDANGTARQSVDCVEDDLIFAGLTLRRTGYIFEGWHTDAELEQCFSLDGTDAVMPAHDITLYAKWKAHSFYVYFDAAGGTVEETSRLVLCDTDFGALPEPTRTGYTFAGWFTEDGQQITATTQMATAEDITVTAKWTVNAYTASWDTGEGYTITVQRASSPNAGAAAEVLSNGATVYYGDVLSVTYTKQDYYSITKQGETGITVTGNVTAASIYAAAELNPVSNWVKASDMPEGAQVLETKWSYLQREYTSSAASTLSGWTKYDTKRTSWGAWSGWSTTNPTNGVRNVQSRTEYHYYRWVNGYGMYTYKKDSSYWLEETWFTSILPTSSYGSSLGYVNSDQAVNLWARADYSGNYSVSKTWTRTTYRYQDPVYTYYYYQDVAMETTAADPTGQTDVSNVVTWVKYRAK